MELEAVRAFVVGIPARQIADAMPVIPGETRAQRDARLSWRKSILATLDRHQEKCIEDEDRTIQAQLTGQLPIADETDYHVFRTGEL